MRATDALRLHASRCEVVADQHAFEARKTRDEKVKREARVAAASFRAAGSMASAMADDLDNTNRVRSDVETTPVNPTVVTAAAVRPDLLAPRLGFWGRLRWLLGWR